MAITIRYYGNIDRGIIGDVDYVRGQSYDRLQRDAQMAGRQRLLLGEAQQQYDFIPRFHNLHCTK
jgi:hypothetical protein